MSSTVFYQGAAEFARLRNVFTVEGVPADPSTVSLVVTSPVNEQTTYTYNPGTITRSVIEGDITFEQLVPCSAVAGLWQFEWIGTGVASDVAEGTWYVFPAAAGQWYTSLEEVKSRLGITDTADDFEIQIAVQSAARYIEGRCGRFFYQVEEVRTFEPEEMFELRIDDCVSVTTLKVDLDGLGSYTDTWTEGTHFKLKVAEGSYNPGSSGERKPYNVVEVIGGGSKYFPFVWPLYHRDRVQIDGVWGWPAVPVAVKQAALQLSADLYKLKDAPFGVQGFTDFGVIAVRAGSQIDRLLTPYISSRRKVGV